MVKNMGKKIIFIMIFSLIARVSAYAAVIEGVSVPDTLAVGDAKLVLNGAGMRVKKIGPIKKDVYVASLYLKDKTSDARKIIDDNDTMVLRIKIVTSLITSKKFIDHAREGFKESTKGNTAPIQKEIDIFLSAFVDEIHDGDLFEITYKKNVGVQVFKNGSKESKITVAGMPIKSALFGIWLGERSEDNLKTLAKHLVTGDVINR